MGKLNRSFERSYWIKSTFILLSLNAALSLSSAQAGSIVIPLYETDAPAVDLLYNGKAIDRDQAIDLSRQGIDISLLNPSENDAWSSKPVQILPENILQDRQEVQFEQYLTSANQLFRSQVLMSGEGMIQRYQLMMSLNSHASMARAALLRKLGYPVPLPKHFLKLTVKFNSSKQKEDFLNHLSDTTLTARKRWIVSESDAAVTLKDVVLEPAEINIPMYHWGIIPASHLKGRRALRALLLPLVFLEIQESVNLYAWEVGKVLNRSLFLSHPYAESFSEATYEDLKWIARKIAHLSRTDFSEILKSAHYPTDIEKLLLEKVIARRNQLIEMLALENEMGTNAKLSYNNKITEGNIYRGKLSPDSDYPDYALRFTYGDPKSPLRKSEIARYFAVQGFSAAIGAILQKVNTFLQINSPNEITQKHLQDVQDEFIKHYNNHPNDPFQQSLKTWGGFSGGFNVQASRNVMTGTYYGSDSRVQLVDNLSVSASVGYFMGLDGVPLTVPLATGNLSVIRNYIHIRPILDIKTALKTNWAQLYVPSFMMKITSMLKTDKEGDDAKNDLSEKLKKVLDELKDGEMLIVTDSLALGVQGKITVPLPVLMNPALVQFNPTLGVTVGSQPTVLKRTTFTRTSEGIQVYLQNAATVNAEIAFDFNWWINLVRWSHSNKIGMDTTRAFIIDKEPEDINERYRLAIAIRALLTSNDSELFEENYDSFSLKHFLKSAVNRLGFLWWRKNTLEETHQVRISPQAKDSEVASEAETRTLYRTRSVTTLGTDPVGTLNEALTTVTGGIVPTIVSSRDINPANAFLGSSRWTAVATEAEITEHQEKPSVTTVEHHWGGWKLSQGKLLSILSNMEKEMADLENRNLLPQSSASSHHLIRKDEFQSTTQLQMYDILSTLILYPKAIEKLTAPLLERDGFVDLVTGLIEREGVSRQAAWCRKSYRVVANKLFRINSVSEISDDHVKTRFKCVKPWIGKVVKLRQERLFSKNRQGGVNAPVDEMNAKSQVHWTQRLVQTLESAMPLYKLLGWIGFDPSETEAKYFYQIKVSGFRKNDENGDTEYLSDSVGYFDAEKGAGAFRDFSSKYGITQNEIYARYLSDGF